MSPELKLPALRGLGTLADHKPVIVVDSREQQPLSFSRLQAIRGMLLTGDYSVSGLQDLFAVERKWIDDLVGCCIGESRARFERELHRLRGFRFNRLLIIGSERQIIEGQYHSSIAPKAVLGTLGAFEIRYDLPLVFCETPEVASRLIERWAFYFARETVQVVNDLLRGIDHP
jgi:ERCC4-type nuclease